MSEVGIRNLNHLRVFMAIVEKGSFTAAAECLSMSKSLVSEYLSRLEAEIDTQLVMRSTRRIAPTDAGNKLYCASQAFVSGLYDVIGSIRCLRHESTGLLRVAAPSGFSTTHLSSIAATFIHQHPQIELEIVCNDDEIDLVGERVDLAFETGWPKKKGFRMKMLGAFDQVLVASPEYARRHAVPRHPDDLPGSHWIGHGGLANLSYSVFGNEERSVRIQTPGRLKVKSVLLAHQMALAGAGISAFPDYLVAEDLREGRLHRLLPTWTMPKGGIYAFRTAPRQASVRERLFLAAVQAYLAGLCGEHARGRGPDLAARGAVGRDAAWLGSVRTGCPRRCPESTGRRLHPASCRGWGVPSSHAGVARTAAQSAGVTNSWPRGRRHERRRPPARRIAPLKRSPRPFRCAVRCAFRPAPIRRRRD